MGGQKTVYEKKEGEIKIVD